jgi:hypothetical protein
MKSWTLAYSRVQLLFSKKWQNWKVVVQLGTESRKSKVEGRLTKNSKNSKSKTAPQSVDLSVGGDMKESVAVIGDNNVVNYYAVVSTNVEKHEPDFWNLKHPYPMPPNFTGRVAERTMLTQWLNEDSENHLFILRALGGRKGMDQSRVLVFLRRRC